MKVCDSLELGNASITNDDERYELIASIAQGIDEYKCAHGVEDSRTWDSSDINFDLNQYIYQIA